ncbi:MAG TPA: hypothetical protein VFF40_04775 [Acidimicrobiia bacterium]|nr:hypothetical protein [Acidimicrobiia bacterium]
MSTEPKVVITGTGRAGTTLLVQILTDLGLDTGFDADHRLDDRIRAGLEFRIESPGAPRIIKDPNLSRRLGDLLDRGVVDIGHVIVPIRDLDVATASRVRNTRYGADLHTFGGLFGTARATRQRDALAGLFYELFWTIARYELAHTLLEFPRFATDWEYTYRRLSFLDPAIPAHRWREVIEARTDAALIHETPLTRGERAKTILGTAYNRGIARPLRAARRLMAGDDPRS